VCAGSFRDLLNHGQSCASCGAIALGGVERRVTAAEAFLLQLTKRGLRGRPELPATAILSHRLGRTLRCPPSCCIDIDPKAIPPNRTYRSARYFSRGEFARLA
jgi:hypothetical protein